MLSTFAVVQVLSQVALLGVSMQLCLMSERRMIEPWSWPLESFARSTRYMPRSLSGKALKRVNQITYANGALGHSEGAGSINPSRLAISGRQKMILSWPTLHPVSSMSEPNLNRDLNTAYLELL